MDNKIFYVYKFPNICNYIHIEYWKDRSNPRFPLLSQRELVHVDISMPTNILFDFRLLPAQYFTKENALGFLSSLLKAINHLRKVRTAIYIDENQMALLKNQLSSFDTLIPESHTIELFTSWDRIRNYLNLPYEKDI